MYQNTFDNEGDNVIKRTNSLKNMKSKTIEDIKYKNCTDN